MYCEELKLTLSCKEAKQVNPLVLAYIGDAAYEIFIRTYLFSKNPNLNVHKLHLKGIKYVKAHAQSEYIKEIIETLSEDELGIFKRGRNAKSYTSPKNANITEYRMATGFEALIGYLHITGQKERMLEIFNFIINKGEI